MRLVVLDSSGSIVQREALVGWLTLPRLNPTEVLEFQEELRNRVQDVQEIARYEPTLDAVETPGSIWIKITQVGEVVVGDQWIDMVIETIAQWVADINYGSYLFGASFPRG